MPDLSVKSDVCRWCRLKPVRFDGAELCTDCHKCAGCSKSDVQTLFRIGGKLLCAECNQKAKEKAASEREAQYTQVRLRNAGFYSAHDKVNLQALDDRQRRIATEYLAFPFGNLVICGGSGSGKTWTANATLKTLIERGSTGRWLSMPWLFASLRDWIGNDKDFKMTGYVDRILEFDYIVLDDLGAHRATDWAIETLYLILDQWEANDKRGLICTTNLTMDEISKNFSDRIASRLAASCKIVKLDGDDKRLKAKKVADAKVAGYND